MTDYPISITSICDYIFCPYSCYLQNIYKDMDVNVYHCIPQKRGVIAHEKIDKRVFPNERFDLQSITVYSEKLGVMGKIDLYSTKEKMLVEYKCKIPQFELSARLQLWIQYLCMREMGFEVERLALYDCSTSSFQTINLPTDDDMEFIESVLEDMRKFNPISSKIILNKNKCRHCIYSNLCNKTSEENVYN